MKKSILKLVAAGAMACGLALSVLAQTPAVSNFSQTMKHLDQGGISLTYTDLPPYVSFAEDLFKVAVDVPAVKQDPNLTLLKKVVEDLWAQIGLNAFRGYGNSLVRQADGDYVYRSFCGIDFAKATPLVKEISPDSKELPFIELMPDKTIAAFGANLNMEILWKLINDSINKFGSDEVKGMVAAQLAMAQMQGFDVNAMLASVTGIGGYIEYDAAHPEKALSGAIFLGTKNTSIIDSVRKLMQAMNPKACANGEIQFPAGDCVMTMFQHKNTLVITTTPVAVKTVIAGKVKNLKANADYAKYAAMAPASGNSFLFISSICGKQLLPLIEKNLPQDTRQWMNIKAIFDLFGLDRTTFASSWTEPDGDCSIMVTGSRPLALFVASPSAWSSISSALSSFVQKKAQAGSNDALELEEEELDDADDDDDGPATAPAAAPAPVK